MFLQNIFKNLFVSEHFCQAVATNLYSTMNDLYGVTTSPDHSPV